MVRRDAIIHKIIVVPYRTWQDTAVKISVSATRNGQFRKVAHPFCILHDKPLDWIYYRIQGATRGSRIDNRSQR